MFQFEYQNKNFALGLWWQTLEAKIKRKAKKEAKQLISELDSVTEYNQFVLNKKKGVFQSGLGFNSLDNTNGKEKIYSLAGCILNAEDQNVIGHFLFTDCSWVIVIINGQILAEGDFYSKDRNEAYLFFQEQLEKFDNWEKIIEPQSVEESYEALELYLERVEKKDLPLLVNSEFVFPLKKVVSVCIVFLILLGIFSLNKARKQRKIEEERQRHLELVRSELEKKRKKEPWLSEPLPAKLLAACLEAFNEKLLVEKGWELVSFSYSNEEILTKRKRLSYGSFLDMPEKAVSSLENPNLAVSKENRDALPKREKGNNGKVINKKSVAPLLFEASKFIEAPIQIEWGKENIMINANNYSKGEFVIQDIKTYPDKKFHMKIKEIESLIIKSIEYNAASENWAVKGVFYVTQ